MADTSPAASSSEMVAGSHGEEVDGDDRGSVVVNPLSSGSGLECPFGFGGSSAEKWEQVAARQSSEAVNPRNMMPTFSQERAPDQKVDLSVEREKSTIPKTGEDATWVYPSPQQFYHALRRRNKSAEAESMDAVVYIHNSVNERTWEGILDWERKLHPECIHPSLQRFVGRFNDLSLRAQLHGWVYSRARPFDRHDWFIDRCGQRTVRYIVDYYDEPTEEADERGFDVVIESRPAALDSLGNFWDCVVLGSLDVGSSLMSLSGLGSGVGLKEGGSILVTFAELTSLLLLTEDSGRYRSNGCFIWVCRETARLGCRPHPIDECPTDPSLYEFAGDIYKSVVSEFGLACENSSWAVALQSELFFGFLVGVWAIGWMGDRFGRKPALWLSVVTTQLFGLLSFVAPTYLAYAISRLGVGLGIGGLGLSSYVLATEVTAPEWRSLVCVVTSSIFALATVLTLKNDDRAASIVAVSSLAAIPNIHWRMLSFGVWMLSWACVLPALLLTLFLESPVWLEARGRHAEAEAGLRKIAIVNNRQAEFDSFLKKWDDQHIPAPDGDFSIEDGDKKDSLPASTKEDDSLWGLLVTKRLNIIQEFVAVMVAAWFASSLGYYGLSMNVGNLGGSIYLNSILNALVEIPSYGMMYFMVDNAITGRKLTLTIYLLAGGIACVIGPLFTWLHWLSLTIALLGKFFVSAAFGVCYIYGSELFPTSIRSSALGIQSLAARIAGIISPLVPPLGEVWSPLPNLIFGIPCIVAAVFILRLLPETLGRSLPMTVEDVRALRQYSVGSAEPPRPGHGQTGKYEMPLDEFDTDSSNDSEAEEDERRARTLRDVFGTEFGPKASE